MTVVVSHWKHLRLVCVLLYLKSVPVQYGVVYVHGIDQRTTVLCLYLTKGIACVVFRYRKSYVLMWQGVIVAGPRR